MLRNAVYSSLRIRARYERDNACIINTQVPRPVYPELRVYNATHLAGHHRTAPHKVITAKTCPSPIVSPVVKIRKAAK